jgi:hypothetical protein
MHRVSITFSDEEWQKIEGLRRSQPIRPSAAAVVRHLVASAPQALPSRTVVPPASPDATTPEGQKILAEQITKS